MVLFVAIVAGSFSYHLSFEPSNLVAKQGKKGQVFSLPGCVVNAEPGMPMLPVKNLIIALRGAPDKVKLSYVIEQEVLVDSGVNLERFQPKDQAPTDVPIPLLYEPIISSDYPEKPVQLIRVGYMRSQGLASVQVSPLRLTPDGKLYMATSISVRLDYSESGVKPAGPKITPEFREVLERLVVNPQDLGPAFKPTGLDYVIIAPDDMMGSAEVLAEHRRLSGYNAEVYPLSWFYDNFPGYGAAERIRSGIKWLYQNRGLEYVLLAGDRDRIPDKVTYVPYNSSFGDSVDTDLFYACLDGDWNDQGDWFYGDIMDSIDLFPDVFVGRLPARDSTQLEFMISKILTYERMPGPRAGQILLHAADLFSDGDSQYYAQYMEDYIPDSVHIIDLVQQHHGGWANQTLDDFMDSVALGPGLMISMGHGNHYGISVSKNLNGGGEYNLYVPNALDLSNTQPYFALLMSCFYNNVRHVSIGKTYLRNQIGGAVGTLGDSKEDYPAVAIPLLDSLVKFIYQGYFETSGKVDLYARASFASAANASSVYRRMILGYRLLGDPALLLRTWDPDSFEVTLPSTVSDPMTVHVEANGTPCQGATVALYRDSVVLMSGQTNPAGDITFSGFSAVGGNYLIGTSKRNFITRIDTVPGPSTGPGLALADIRVLDDDQDGVGHQAETLNVVFTLHNYGNQSAPNCAVKASLSDPNLSLITDSAFVGMVFADHDTTCTLSVQIASRTSTIRGSGIMRVVGYSAGDTVFRDSVSIDYVGGKAEFWGLRSSFRADTVQLSVDVLNSGEWPLQNIVLSLNSVDGSCLVIDSVDTISEIQAQGHSDHSSVFTAVMQYPITNPVFNITARDTNGMWFTRDIPVRTMTNVDSGFAVPNQLGVSLFWNPVNRAAGYKVLIAYDAGKSVPVYPGITPNTTINHEPASFRIRTYEITALDSAGNESPVPLRLRQSPSPPLLHHIIDVPTSYIAPPQICEFDPDYPGKEAVIMSHWHTDMFVSHADGSVPAGYPIETGYQGTYMTPAVGDIDGDGKLEVVIGSIYNYEFYAFRLDGSQPAGWPITMDFSVSNYPVLMQDFDNDSLPEIAIKGYDNGKLAIVDGDGSILMETDLGHPGYFNHMAAADVDSDGTVELAAMVTDSSNWYLHLLKPDGTEMPGFPVIVDTVVYYGNGMGINDFSNGGVSIGDVLPDKPGLELVTTTGSGMISVVQWDGSIYNQFRADTTQDGPVLADFDGDGDLDIGFVGNGLPPDAAMTDTCYVFTIDGTKLSAPLERTRCLFRYGIRLPASAIDIDGDGLPEFVVPDRMGIIHGFELDGSESYGFPIDFDVDGIMDGQGIVRGGLAAEDVDLDGRTDLHAVSSAYNYFAWSTYSPFTKGINWQQPTHDRWNTRTYGFIPWDDPLPGVGERAEKPRFFLSAPMPNPSKGALKVQLGIPAKARVDLALYDVAGRRAQTLFAGSLEAGVHTMNFTLDKPSGIYFMRLKCQNKLAVQKTVLIK